MEKKNRLTPKQRRVLMELSKTYDWTKAIMRAYGYSEDEKDLRQKVYQAKKILLKKTDLAEILSAVGLDNITVGRGIKELINATKKPIYKGQFVRDEDGNIVELPDWAARYNGLKLAADMLGMVQKQQAYDIVRQQNNLIVFVESEEDARRRIKENEERQKSVEVSSENYQVEAEA